MFSCSTSQTVFSNKEELTEHYKSDLHRYNLKRKVAGLPPVTSEWFEARKEQLHSVQAQTSAGCIYICPLTNKKFQSEGTYDTYTKTNKYRTALKQAGLSTPPSPKVVARRQQQQQHTQRESSAPHMAHLQKCMEDLAVREETTQPAELAGEVVSDEDDGESSGWETSSQVDDEALAAAERLAAAAVSGSKIPGSVRPHVPASEWEVWDVKRSLFDNHVSESFEKNLEYMYKHFGFHFPDWEYLENPHSLLQYLGAKLQYGHIPLYISGLAPDAKRFNSLHAAQRHMIDTNKCTMLYDENEDEYEDYYEYPESDDGDLALAPDVIDSSYELVLNNSGAGSGMKIIGCRDFRHLYKQRHRPTPASNRAAEGLRLTYSAVGAPKVPPEEIRERGKHEKRRNRLAMKCQIANDKIHKLPKNVPH